MDSNQHRVSRFGVIVYGIEPSINSKVNHHTSLDLVRAVWLSQPLTLSVRFSLVASITLAVPTIIASTNFRSPLSRLPELGLHLYGAGLPIQIIAPVLEHTISGMLRNTLNLRWIDHRIFEQLNVERADD